MKPSLSREFTLNVLIMAVWLRKRKAKTLYIRIWEVSTAAMTGNASAWKMRWPGRYSVTEKRTYQKTHIQNPGFGPS